MFTLFGIGQKDYSKKIIEGSYKVYKEDVTHDWEDGNCRKHRDIIRTRTSGSFTLMLNSWAEYGQLLSDLATVKTGTEYALTVFAVNTNEQVTGSFFMKLPPNLNQKNNLVFTPGAFTISIEEA